LHVGLNNGESEAQSVRQWAVKTFGSAIIDIRYRSAYAIGLCSVDSLSIRPGAIAFNLKNGFKEVHTTPIKVKFKGIRGNSYQVSINGEGKPYPKVELESGIDVTI
jgi:hypothetical protein